jgi:hypothetical protein
VMSNRELLQSMAADAAADGKPIEAGWMSLRSTMNPQTPQEIVDVLRFYFMTGALHLFTTINDYDGSVENQDEFDALMCGLRDELESFARGTLLRHTPTRGNA